MTDTTKMLPVVSRRVEYNRGVVLMNGTPHLSFLIDQYVGLQTWKSPDKFSVEITFKSGAAITTEYDHEAKFKAVVDAVLEITR